MSTLAAPTTELVVLLDDAGQPCGTAAKSAVHTGHTPLHLAFSLHLHDGAGRMLLTRRAVGKAAFPGIWSNACCGHPAPGEEPAAAVRRRAGQELRVEVHDLTTALPTYRYRARDAHGVVEHEVCPVFLGRLDSDTDTGTDVDPDPAEICDRAWVAADRLLAVATHSPFLLSPWAAEQIRLLHAVGRWPT